MTKAWYRLCLNVQYLTHWQLELLNLTISSDKIKKQHYVVLLLE